MTVTADVERGVIHAVVEIAAPPERVFRALTDPEELAAWWGSPDTYTMTWTLDLRVGGKWISRPRRAGSAEEQVVRGEFLAVDPPRLLEYTWIASWDGDARTIIRYELEAIPAGTRLKITHSGFVGRPASCQGHSTGWGLVLGWLRGYSETHPS